MEMIDDRWDLGIRIGLDVLAACHGQEKEGGGVLRCLRDGAALRCGEGVGWHGWLVGWLCVICGLNSEDIQRWRRRGRRAGQDMRICNVIPSENRQDHFPELYRGRD
jgi:hypothetical protein